MGASTNKQLSELGSLGSITLACVHKTETKNAIAWTDKSEK